MEEYDYGHVLYRNFGLTDLEETNAVEELILSTTGIVSTDAQILLREAYETAYQIHDHDREPEHPFGLVLNRKKEDYLSFSPLYKLLTNYRLKDVNKSFGLNLKEFLSLPREYTELIFEICEEVALDDAKAFEVVKNELGK